MSVILGVGCIKEDCIAMRNKADIVVRSPNNDIKLIVEVKGQGQSSPDWAARFRRNLLTHNVIPKSEYFLLALPDFLYLWRAENTSDVVPPDYTARTFNVLQRYLTSLDAEPKYIAQEGLQLALTSWLRDATFSPDRPPVGTDAYKLLVESGLLDAIDNAEVSA